jgi:hypothetical protein
MSAPAPRPLLRLLQLTALLVSATLAALLIQRPAAAQTPVDLELVIAVDISLSMDLDELRIQRGGYVAALRDAEVQKAILGGPRGRIAITYFEWAGVMTQLQIAPWTLIDSVAAADALADVLDKAPVSRHRMTSISGALDHADRMFGQSPYRGIRRVVDVSGDGPNNNGRPVSEARQRLLDKGVVINGLPVMLKLAGSAFDLRNLDIYYADCVIGGPASFIVPVRSEPDFQPAIRRKLLLEIAGDKRTVARLIPTQAAPDAPERLQPSPDAPRIDCMIGEQLWRRYMDGRFPN